VAFRVMEHSPFCLALNKMLFTNGADGGLEVRNFKKQDRFFQRRIRFRAFAFEADKTSLGAELRISLRVLIRNLEAQRIGINTLAFCKSLK
jgi:hypothetical protein